MIKISFKRTLLFSAFAIALLFSLNNISSHAYSNKGNNNDFYARSSNNKIDKDWLKRFVKAGYSYKLKYPSMAEYFQTLSSKPFSHYYHEKYATKIAKKGLLYRVDNIYIKPYSTPTYHFVSKNGKYRFWMMPPINIYNVNTDKKDIKNIVALEHNIINRSTPDDPEIPHYNASNDFHKLYKMKLPKNNSLRVIVKNSIKELRNYVYHSRLYSQVPSLLIGYTVE